MKVDLEKLVSKGSHVRTEIKPTVVIGEGSNAQGELLDSNAIEQLIPQKVSDLQNDANYLASGVIKHVEVMTQLQYDSLDTKDVNTEYNIVLSV